MFGDLILMFGDLILIFGDLILMFGDLILMFGDLILMFGDLIHFCFSRRPRAAVAPPSWQRAPGVLGSLFWSDGEKNAADLWRNLIFGDLILIFGDLILIFGDLILIFGDLILIFWGSYSDFLGILF